MIFFYLECNAFGVSEKNGISKCLAYNCVAWKYNTSNDSFSRFNFIFLLYFSFVPSFDQPLRIACGSCALVSSSGHLLGSGAGKDIDAHDCVIRMNNAPVRGYEKDVGIRTTIRSMANVNLARSFATRNHSRREMLISKETRAEVVLINWMNEQHVRRRKGKEYQYALKLAGRHQEVHFFEFSPMKMTEAERVFHNETGITK